MSDDSENKLRGGIHKNGRRALVLLLTTFVQLHGVATVGMAQSSPSATDQDSARKVSSIMASQANTSSLARYFDPSTGMTAEEAVAYALEHNGELLAMRKQVEAAEAMVRQAALHANPRVDASVSQNITGTDRNITLNGMLPLELGGRRSSRISVAARQVEIRKAQLADRERTLAADVRSSFGRSLAEILKLGFDEELLSASRRGYKLVMARVIEGRTAPLEQNMVLVEVNRLRSIRELSEGKVEISLLELRNLVGMKPEEPLHIRGDFSDMITPLPPLSDATEQAIRARPDLLAARATEALAEAQIEQARATGRLDASLVAGYQRMKSGFPLNGINSAGRLQPIEDNFNYVTFGVSLDLPVRNKNQGAIEAAVAEADAARQQREFAELTVRREVASAYARYGRAARAMEIYRVGVRDQANANLNVVRQTYELGARTLLDYIAEQRRYIELENSYIDAVLDTYQARVETLRASASPELIKK